MKKYTITEYAEKIGKTREAVFYQIKQKKIKAKKNKSNQWEILASDKIEKKEKSNISNDDLLDLKIKVALFEEQKKAFEETIKKENAVLEEKIISLKTELKSKEEIIKAKEETIQAERRTNIALLSTVEQQKNIEQPKQKSIIKKLLFWK